MSDLVRMTLADERGVVVEVEDTGDEIVDVSGGRDPVHDLHERFTRRLDTVRAAVAEALDVLTGSLSPKEITVTFGVKFTAEAGAVISKVASEAHLTVEMRWQPGAGGTERAHG